MTGDPDKEYRTNKPPPTRRAWEWLKGDTTCPLPRIPLDSIHLGVCHQERLWIRVIGQRPPGNKFHHHKTRHCEPHSKAVLLVSLTLLLSTWAPFPIKSLALSAHVSPRTIHFQALDKSPVSGPGRSPPSCNKRTDAEAETPILWPPNVKNWLIGKDPDAGKDWRQEKRTTEGEMVGWHHQLDGHEF